MVRHKNKKAFIKTITIFFTFILCSCASMKVKKEGTGVYKKYTFDEVWNASLSALKELEYFVWQQDKGISLPAFSEKKGIIQARKEKKTLLQVRDPKLFITIKQEGDKILVYCQAIQEGQFYDYGLSSKSIKKFLESLDKNLKK